MKNYSLLYKTVSYFSNRYKSLTIRLPRARQINKHLHETQDDRAVWGEINKQERLEIEHENTSLIHGHHSLLTK